jgi:hypothetical protein
VKKTANWEIAYFITVFISIFYACQEANGCSALDGILRRYREQAHDGWGCKSRSTKHSPPCMHVFAGDWLWCTFCPFFDYLFSKLLGKQQSYCLERAFSGMSVKRTQPKKR